VLLKGGGYFDTVNFGLILSQLPAQAVHIAHIISIHTTDNEQVLRKDVWTTIPPSKHYSLPRSYRIKGDSDKGWELRRPRIIDLDTG